MKLNNAFKVGHHKVDEHHEELFALTTMLDKALFDNDESLLNDIIEFFEHYVEDHFKEEEDIMISADYKGYDHHYQEHQVFKELVKTLRTDYDNNKSRTHIIFDIRRIIDQLTTHIKTVDIGIKDIIKH